MLNTASILLAYPVSVEPTAEFSEGGCIVTAVDAPGSPATPKEACKKIPGARLYKITNAIPKTYGGQISIELRLKNPSSNWGEIGFKLKTYEEVVT